MGTFDKTTQELARLKAVTRPRSQSGDDLKLQLAAMVGGLADLPDDVIGDGCRSWAQQSQWFPTLAELREECLLYRPVPEPKSRVCLPFPPAGPSINARSRARNAYGLRGIQVLQNDPNTKPEDWDALRAEIDRMRAYDTVPGEDLPDEIKDAIG